MPNGSAPTKITTGLAPVRTLIGMSKLVSASNNGTIAETHALNRQLTSYGLVTHLSETLMDASASLSQSGINSTSGQ